MAEFVKDLSLGWSLASGVAEADQRSGSVHFDQRRVNQGSGVILVDQGRNARGYAVDGAYPLSDIWQLDILDLGTLRIQTPYSHQMGDVWVLNEQGQEVLRHEPSKYTRRDYGSSTVALGASGVHYMYVELRGRRSCEYRTLIQIDGSQLGNSLEDSAPLDPPDRGRRAPFEPPTPGAGDDFYRLPLPGGEVIEIIDEAATFNNFNSEDVTAVAADGQPAVADPEGSAAWYYGNSGTGSEKINWYFYGAPGSPSAPVGEFTLGDIDVQYILFRPEGNDAPFLTLYTIPEGDGGDAASWYRSRQNHLLPIGGYTPGEWVLGYWGGEAPDAGLFPDFPRVQMQLNPFTARGPQADSESILYYAVSTNSAAAPGAASAAVALVGQKRGSDRDFYTFLLTNG
jgi:hypothetical protein